MTDANCRKSQTVQGTISGQPQILQEALSLGRILIGISKSLGHAVGRTLCQSFSQTPGVPTNVQLESKNTAMLHACAL